MCTCEGTGVIEVYVFGLREVPCPADDCTYWNGEQQ
jgi:hypothetical protein